MRQAPLLGAGAASLITAGVLALLLVQEHAVVNDHCRNRQCDDTGLRAAGAADTLQTGTIVSSAAAAALGVSGGALLMWPTDSGNTRTGAARAKISGLVVTASTRF